MRCKRERGVGGILWCSLPDRSSGFLSADVVFTLIWRLVGEARGVGSLLLRFSQIRARRISAFVLLLVVHSLSKKVHWLWKEVSMILGVGEVIIMKLIIPMRRKENTYCSLTHMPTSGLLFVLLWLHTLLLLVVYTFAGAHYICTIHWHALKRW